MFYSVIDLEGKVIAECFTRDAAYLAYRDAMSKGARCCRIEATGGQPVELVRACRQRAAATAYVKSTVSDYSKNPPKSMVITRGTHKYVVPSEMMKKGGELKKSAIDAINRYFASLAKKEVATT